ncbi:protoheme IX farnesyltransferase [Halosimplex rubrum]|uniref:Protoheme IX farnesyltransferase n=1 Tax=Halosimplex rubrum TaxID=869889 RepID=A0A7D5T480_9EURY|nr:heme o synthase [Halosimplex rubrum]QLH77510.1 protoheme IX farnesyltransferase [Halosimplex rubrum]
MFSRDSRPSFPSLLAATAMGVYLLVAAGATASVADAARACSSWPVCHGPLTLADPALLIAWAHRVVALLVGVLALATAVAAVRDRAAIRGRVLAALALGLVLFPVQVAIGAVVVTGGAAALPAGAHLAVGMVLFTALVVALAWELEPETPDAPEEGWAVEPGVDAEATDSSETLDDDTVAEPTTVPSDLPLRTRVTATVSAYFRLTKPRLMWLLCLVAAAGMALASTGTPDLTVRTVVLTLGGGVLAIGASGTFNHVLEREKDKKMDRTSDRPIATHQIPVRRAVAFGLTLAASSLVVFAQLNLLAAALGLSAILFYSVVYTLVLKPNTVQNTVIGGFAGALPALIGWAAVTGEFGLPGAALAGVIFLWTPAHFYNLALAYKEDYARGGFPMMPVVRGEAATRKHILYYLAATLVAAVALAELTALGWMYAATTCVFGGVFLWAVLRLHRERTESAAFRAFHASNAYLGALLIAIVVDALAL